MEVFVRVSPFTYPYECAVRSACTYVNEFSMLFRFPNVTFIVFPLPKSTLLFTSHPEDTYGARDLQFSVPQHKPRSGAGEARKGVFLSICTADVIIARKKLEQGELEKATQKVNIFKTKRQ